MQWLVALHALVLALLFAVPLPAWATLVIAVAVALSWHRLRRHPAFGYGRTAITRIVETGTDGWRIGIADAEPEAATPLSGSAVWPGLLVLGFRTTDGRARHRVVFGDEADDESLRKLRARLLNPPDLPEAS